MTGMRVRIITLWKTPRDAICVVALASSAAHFANATASETLMSAPRRFCRNGAKPIAEVRQTKSR